MTVSAEQVLESVRSHRDEFVACLCDLVREESPSLHPAGVRRVQRMVARNLERNGLRVHFVPGRRSGGHFYAVPRRRVPGRPAQLLIGHSDTVWPIGTLATMPVTAEDGRVRGPGVFDMKAGLAQIVLATRVLAELELEPPLTPVVFVNSDEEVGSIESQRYVERFARAAQRAYVMEPALGPEGRIKTARKGTGHFDVIIRGRASHAGIAPEEGASAILEMSHVIQRLFALNDPARGISVNVGTVAGGLRSNVVAPESRAGVDVRVLTRDDARRVEAVVRDIKAITPGVTVEIQGSIDRGPMENTPRNASLWQLARSLGEELGLALEEGTSGGASDGNITSEFTATLDGLGPVGHGAHAAHEYIDIDRTLERCALLVLLLMAPPLD